jgi:hypothetical protein
MIAPSRVASNADALAEKLSPLIRMEMASIGAIESAGPREAHPGYTILFQDAKQGKQANVEQMNTLLRLVGRSQVESGGILGPMLHLQTLALQHTNLTALLSGMLLVEEALVAKYRDLLPSLDGLARTSMDHVFARATQHWLVILAHTAQRKEGNSGHADELPLPLSAYFATEEDRVCMRCLFDRAGDHAALEKADPHTYLCAACHDETIVEFPPDLREQNPTWSVEAHRDRVLQKALGRLLKLTAIKEVQSTLAGLRAQVPVPATANAGETPVVRRARHEHVATPRSDILLDRNDAAPNEQAYTDLLFDFRSVRSNW